MSQDGRRTVAEGGTPGQPSSGEPPGGAGPPGQAVTLYLPGGVESGGFLVFSWPDGETRDLVVELRAALARPIVVLFKALQKDGLLVRQARGWRRPEVLAEMIADLSPVFIPCQTQTVRSYLAEISRTIRTTAEREGFAEVPRLLAFKRSFGVKLAIESLELVDGQAG